MPPATGRKQLKVGDTVSVPATTFGQAWAKRLFPGDWHRQKIQGAVVGRAGDKWSLSFPDEEGDLVITDVVFETDACASGQYKTQGGGCVDYAPGQWCNRDQNEKCDFSNAEIEMCQHAFCALPRRDRHSEQDIHDG